MVTLIAAYNSDGCIGRCDAKCYNAENPACDCICRGMNHGAGLSKAIDNTQEMVKSWIEAYEKEHPETQEWFVRRNFADMPTRELCLYHGDLKTKIRGLSFVKLTDAQKAELRTLQREMRQVKQAIKSRQKVLVGFEE